jgi:3-oxoadipate enol-lactonase
VGGQLRYERFANGAAGTVVLLHSLALDATIWADFARRLDPGLTVIAPDLPGHGRQPAGDPTSVESMADGVAALLRNLGVRDVALVGMSLGGSVAQAVAIRHPDLVSRLGLIDTTAWYGPDAPAAWAGRAQQAVERGLASLAGFQLELWFGDAFREQTPEVGERLLDIFQRNELDNYVASCNALGRMDQRDLVPTIAVPTAVVVGERDQATPPAMAGALHEAIEDSVLTVIPDCKHLSALERPDDVIAALGSIVAPTALHRSGDVVG